MLWYGDGVVRVIVVSSDLLHVKVSEDSSEYDIEQLNTA